MYRVAVCDDDGRHRETLGQMILSLYPGMDIAYFDSGEALLAEYHPYDAIFLDIDMEGMDGIETGRGIRRLDRNTKIIYLTSYRDYVAGAFGVHAFQYLLKPVREKEIRHVLEEAFRYINKEKKQILLDFQTVDGLVCLNVDDIYYFEYENRGVQIVTESVQVPCTTTFTHSGIPQNMPLRTGVQVLCTTTYKMTGRIGAVAQRMAPYGFSVPHQSFVVNLLHVKNVGSGRILLDNGIEIPLAQKKQKTWKKELVDYLSGRLGESR